MNPNIVTNQHKAAETTAPRKIPGHEVSSEEEDESREWFLEHYRNPRNQRPLLDADLTGAAKAPSGATLTFYLRLSRGVNSAGAGIEQATFQSQRCGVAVAYASLLTEILRGMDVARALDLRPGELVAHFGERAGAYEPAALAIAALQNTLKPTLASS